MGQKDLESKEKKKVTPYPQRKKDPFSSRMTRILGICSFLTYLLLFEKGDAVPQWKGKNQGQELETPRNPLNIFPCSSSYYGRPTNNNIQ